MMCKGRVYQAKGTANAKALRRDCAWRVQGPWRRPPWLEQKSFTYQFSSVAQLYLTLSDPMNHSMPGLPVHHQLEEFTQTHVHWVSDAIQPSLRICMCCSPCQECPSLFSTYDEPFVIHIIKFWDLPGRINSSFVWWITCLPQQIFLLSGLPASYSFVLF